MSASTSASTSTRASTRASSSSLDLEGPEPKYFIPPMEQDGLEDVERYEPGGFHPVHIDDFLCDGRFEVAHKLGQGGFATVWLCRDHHEERWCALKIMASAPSSEEGGDLKVIKRFREKGIDSQKAAAHHIVLPEEHFWIDGPNGRHLALVTPLLGPSLAYWLQEEERTFEAMTGFCRQMAKGLKFLHESGICHGDFRPANILLKVRNIDAMPLEEICELLDGPDAIDIRLTSGEESTPHAPEYLVKPAWWGDALEQGIVLEEIAIVDFGEAFLDGEPAKFTGIPRIYAAPEVTFDQKPSTASDIWALGVSIMEVYGSTLFSPRVLLTAERLEDYLGPLPLEYREDFEKQHRAYLTSRREHEDLCERNLLKQGLEEHVDKKPKTEPSDWVLTEAQRTDPSHPVTCTSVSNLRERQEEGLLEAGYSHPISLPLSYTRTGYFKGPNPRHNKMGSWHLTRDEVLGLTDLALEIFRYDTQERLTPAQILEHPWLKEEVVEAEDAEGAEDAEDAEDAGDVEDAENAEDAEDEGILGLGFLQRVMDSLWPPSWWYFRYYLV
ncbi:kinase-like domain-containing protein [Apiospora rasikravindrae]|uniref:EKC/KEOPS complex subunit BUD32 n=1 Tax=Apiospora rasikravindrae TaxID=990691 RepID=A0ABR1TZU4_9PEZI